MKKISKILSIFLCLAMAIGLMATIASAADDPCTSITYDFSSIVANGEEITDGDALFAASTTDAHAHLTGVTLSKVYNGNSGTSGALQKKDGYLKLGTSSKHGEITLTYAAGTSITSVDIYCHDWYTKSDDHPTNSNKVSVNSSTAVLVPYNEDGTCEKLSFTLSEPSNELHIDADKRIFISKIVVNGTIAVNVCTHTETTYVKTDSTHQKFCANTECGEKLEDVAAHTYTDGVCVCGATEPKLATVADGTYYIANADGSKVLSSTYPSGEYYNSGVDKADATNAEIWTIKTENGVTTITLYGTENKLGLGDTYSSMKVEASPKHAEWKLYEGETEGTYYLWNTREADGEFRGFLSLSTQYGTWEVSTEKYEVTLIAATPTTDDKDEDKDDDKKDDEKDDDKVDANLGAQKPVAGTAYKWGMCQENVDKFVYFAGTTANKDYYLATTENFEEATDVYVEAVEGGYHLYFMDGETKTYIDIIVTDTGYVNISLTTEPTAVFEYDETYKTMKTLIETEAVPEGEYYYIGTHSEYTTLSASKFSYAATSFTSHFYTENPDTGDVAIGAVVALLAVSALGIAVVAKKKEF